jgi:hypothetical protein
VHASRAAALTSQRVLGAWEKTAPRCRRLLVAGADGRTCCLGQTFAPGCHGAQEGRRCDLAPASAKLHGRAPHESGKAFLRATSATVALNVRRSRFAFSDQRNVTCLTRARAKGE